MQEQLATRAHVRPAITLGGKNMEPVTVSPDSASAEAAIKKNAWRHEKFLNRFREKFDVLSKKRSSNWPILPDNVDDVNNERLYTSLLVIYIKCNDSVVETTKWEKAFIGQLSTLRGKDMMIGESGLKPDLQLKLSQKKLDATKEAVKAEVQRAIEAKKAKAEEEEKIGESI